MSDNWQHAHIETEPDRAERKKTKILTEKEVEMIKAIMDSLIDTKIKELVISAYFTPPKMVVKNSELLED